MHYIHDLSREANYGPEEHTVLGCGGRSLHGNKDQVLNVDLEQLRFYSGKRQDRERYSKHRLVLDEID